MAETITTTIHDAFPAVMKKMRGVITIGACIVFFLFGLVCVTQVRNILCLSVIVAIMFIVG